MQGRSRIELQYRNVRFPLGPADRPVTVRVESFEPASQIISIRFNGKKIAAVANIALVITPSSNVIMASRSAELEALSSVASQAPRYFKFFAMVGLPISSRDSL